MDSPRLLYALYLNYYRMGHDRQISLTYTEFLEKLCQLLALDDEALPMMMKITNDYENMVNTQAQQDADERLDYDKDAF